MLPRLLSTMIRQRRRWSGGLRARERGGDLPLSRFTGAAASLQTCELGFATTFKHMPIGAALVAPDGHFLQVNPALCHLLGYAERALLSLTFEDVTHPDDLAAGRLAMRGLMAGEYASFHLEKRYVRADRSRVPAMLDVVLVRDRCGHAR